MNPQYNLNANFQATGQTGNPSATSPEKAKYLAKATTSPGAYKGTPIQAGSDAYVAEQIKNIDAGNTGTPAPTSTGTPTPPPTPTPSNPVDDAFSSYLQTLQQPDEVTQATKYVNSLITQGKLDQETALNKGETLGFATGEAARVGRNNSIQLDAASRGLDALVASNASKTTIAKARLDYEQAKLNADKSANAPFELSPGQSRYAYNPKTGAYEQVASVPPTPAKVTAADQKAVLDSDVNSAVDQLGKIVKAKGYRGVSVDDYNTMRQYLQDSYGVNGVIELDKALKALGLTVDTNFVAEDAKLKK